MSEFPFNMFGGGDPDETPAAMRDRPSAVGDLVLLVFDAGVHARVAFEGPVLGHRRRVADDGEPNDRLLPARDQ